MSAGSPPSLQSQGGQTPQVAVAIEVNNVVTGVAIPGAIESGPASIGGMFVVSRMDAPGFEVAGDRYSVLQKTMQPNETFQSEQGVMMFMSDQIKMKATFGGWRMFSGEGLAKVQYRNSGSEPGYIGLTPNAPMAIVIPHNTGGPPLNCKRGAFMAGDSTVRVYPSILPASSCMACCCGGMPPIIQKVTGSGTALLAAGGTIVKKELAAGEKIMVDTDSVVAFSDGVNYDVKTVGSFLACCLGGEGCFNTLLTGPGTVYVQTLSYEKLMKMLVTQTGGGEGKGGESGGGDGGGAPPADEKMER